MNNGAKRHKSSAACCGGFMRRLGKIALMIVVLIVMEVILGFCLEPVTYADYLERDLKTLQKEGIEPDVVFVGDSRVYRTFVPEIFDREFEDGNHCSINLGTGSQSVRGSYYYLKDISEQYPIQYAVVGLTYSAYMKQGAETVHELLVWDRLKQPDVKVQFWVNSFSVQEWPYLLKSYRYKDNIDSALKNIREKISVKLYNEADIREEEHYADRGFIWSDSGYPDGKMDLPYEGFDLWSDEKKDEDAFVWLDKICELCREKCIELIFVTGPTTLPVIYSGDYENSYEMFQDYADVQKVPYFELNFLKDRTDWLPDSMMHDLDHVSGEGAERTTERFCDILNLYLAGEDVSSFFCESVEELQENVNAVVACDFTIELAGENGEQRCLAQSIAQDGRTVEYEFLIADEDGSWKVLQPYSNTDRCTLPDFQSGQRVRIRVNARLAGSRRKWEAYMEKEGAKEEGQGA